jgi:hypothetical protein
MVRGEIPRRGPDGASHETPAGRNFRPSVPGIRLPVRLPPLPHAVALDGGGPAAVALQLVPVPMSGADSQVYSRIYHRLMNEYTGLWRNDAQLALFVRLLVLADKFWPEDAPLPRLRTSALRSLIDSGVITVDGHDNFQVRGLDAERTRRSDAARTAARIRHAVPSALPSKEEKSREEKGAAHDGRHGATCLVCRPLLSIEGGKSA